MDVQLCPQRQVTARQITLSLQKQNNGNPATEIQHAKTDSRAHQDSSKPSPPSPKNFDQTAKQLQSETPRHPRSKAKQSDITHPYRVRTSTNLIFICIIYTMYYNIQIIFYLISYILYVVQLVRYAIHSIFYIILVMLPCFYSEFCILCYIFYIIHPIFDMYTPYIRYEILYIYIIYSILYMLYAMLHRKIHLICIV